MDSLEYLHNNHLIDQFDQAEHGFGVSINAREEHLFLLPPGYNSTVISEGREYLDNLKILNDETNTIILNLAQINQESSWSEVFCSIFAGCASEQPENILFSNSMEVDSLGEAHVALVSSTALSLNNITTTNIYKLEIINPASDQGSNNVLIFTLHTDELVINTDNVILDGKIDVRSKLTIKAGDIGGTGNIYAPSLFFEDSSSLSSHFSGIKYFEEDDILQKALRNKLTFNNEVNQSEARQYINKIIDFYKTSPGDAIATLELLFASEIFDKNLIHNYVVAEWYHELLRINLLAKDSNDNEALIGEFLEYYKITSEKFTPEKLGLVLLKTQSKYDLNLAEINKMLLLLNDKDSQVLEVLQKPELSWSKVQLLRQISRIENDEGIASFYKYLCMQEKSSIIAHYFSQGRQDTYCWNLEKLTTTADQKLLHENLLSLSKIGWPDSEINTLLQDLIAKKYTEDLSYVNYALDTVYNYNLNKEIWDEAINTSSLEDLEESLYHISKANRFHTTDETILSQLIQELKVSNNYSYAGHKKILDFLKDDKLEAQYNRVIEIYNGKSKIFNRTHVAIKNWNDQHITDWSQEVKKNPVKLNESDSLLEAVAVAKRAYEVFEINRGHNYTLRLPQILSLIIILNNLDKGYLAQVNTGEGKTIVIAMLATIKSLSGQKVDIVTSSPVLATRDATEMKLFYGLFDLSVAENNVPNKEKKANYKNDIVYGSLDNFQYDLLSDHIAQVEHQGKHYTTQCIRCDRAFNVIIADEVDSMLIDEHSRIAKITPQAMPTMDYLEIIPVTIWQHLNMLLKQIVQVDDRNYFINVPFSVNGETLTLYDNSIDDNDAVNSPVIEIEDVGKFLHIVLAEQITIKNLLERNITIPQHLNEFATKQLPKWIDSAIAAATYKEGRQYNILDADGKKKIVPVDYQNTGVFQKNMVFADGLHQFLQIKHNLRISSEGLSTTYLSNMEYFSEYKNIYGLSGTLGSISARELLVKMYNVDIMIVPPYKHSQFFALNPSIVDTYNEWLNSIASNTKKEIEHGRAILIIAEDQNHARTICDNLINKRVATPDDILTYIGDNDKLPNIIESGRVIVATNLAGRGTDIKVSKQVKENGGLHVLVTFLPNNLRIEQQALGRAARQGEPGTGQLVINLAETYISGHSDDDLHNFKQLNKLRDEKEKSYLDHIEKRDAEIIKLNDWMYKEFYELLKVKKTSFKTSEQVNAIKQEWGLWLKTLNISNNDVQQYIAKCKEEFIRFKEKVIRGDAIKNPAYYIGSGNRLIKDDDYVKDALVLYNKAIMLDHIYSIYAYYYKSYALVKLQEGEYKIDAQVSLEKAKEIIDNKLIPQLQSIIILSPQLSAGETEVNDLSEQIMTKISILNMLVSYIDNALSVIKSLNKDQELKAEFKELAKAFSIEDADGQLKSEIIEFKANGLSDLFLLEAYRPAKWWEILTVSLIGVAQLVLGAAITVFSVGSASNIGAALMAEGVGDIFYGIQSAVENKFDWKEYGMQKGISLAISVATGGLGALKEIAKMGKTVAIKSLQMGKNIASKFTTNVGKKMATEQAVNTGERLAVGHISHQTVGELSKEGWKLVGRQIGNGLARHGAINTINFILDKTVIASLSQVIKEELEKSINTDVQILIDSQDMQKILKSGQKDINYLKDESQKTIHKYEDSSLLASAKQVIPQVLQAASQGTSDSTGKKILGTLSNIASIVRDCIAIKKLEDIAKNIRIELDKRIEGIAANELYPVSMYILQDTTKHDELCTKLKQAQAVDNYCIEVTDYKKKVEYEGKSEQIQGKLIEFHSKKITNLNQKNHLSDYIKNGILELMMKIIEGELIKPHVHKAISSGISKLNINPGLQNNLLEFKAQRTIKFQQDAMSSNNPGQPQPDIRSQLVNRLTNKDSEGSWLHLGALSKSVQRPIEVYDNQGKRLYNVGNIGQNKDNPPVQLTFHKASQNKQGHWSPRNVEEFKPSGKNNCLFDAVAASVKKPSGNSLSGDALRVQANQHIRDNVASYNKIAPQVSILWYDKNLLYFGGTWSINIENQIYHFKKHNTEFGGLFINEQAYHDAADLFIKNPPKGTEYFVNKNGQKYYYCKSNCADTLKQMDAFKDINWVGADTNWFITINKQGHIKTFFRPVKEGRTDYGNTAYGSKYFNRQTSNKERGSH